MGAITVLAYREWVRFLRSPGRIIGALGAPLIFWGLLGSGMGSSFTGAGTGGQGYLEYFYPGMLAMVILFTSIFASISLIEDRREGFLQMVLVTRVPRTAVVIGKVLGATVLATVQAGFLLLLAPLVGFPLSVSEIAASLGVLFVNGLVLSALGFLCAWKFNSVQSFHSVMNLLLFPMWLLSGALFPAEGAASWIRWVMIINPLTYGVTALRSALGVSEAHAYFSTAIWILAAFGIVFTLVSTFLVGRSRSLVSS